MTIDYFSNEITCLKCPLMSHRTDIDHHHHNLQSCGTAQNHRRSPQDLQSYVLFCIPYRKMLRRDLRSSMCNSDRCCRHCLPWNHNQAHQMNNHHQNQHPDHRPLRPYLRSCHIESNSMYRPDFQAHFRRMGNLE